ncbi:MAG: hypothetical protein A3K19_23185 [Lentisphaerae bacterium RIFOXYB12_FULL_65_16]|nr:MAG: hypothetical protein A3K19_23185 [Lentisphaerae bacterium RIFOXYB12_FULL_65_16]
MTDHGGIATHPPALNASGRQTSEQASASTQDERLAQAKAAALEDRERLRSVLDNSLDVIYRRNLRTDHYDCVSPSVEKLTGYTPEEFTSGGLQSTVDRVHPDDVADARRAIEDVMTNQASPLRAT